MKGEGVVRRKSEDEEIREDIQRRFDEELAKGVDDDYDLLDFEVSSDGKGGIDDRNSSNMNSGYGSGDIDEDEYEDCAESHSLLK